MENRNILMIIISISVLCVIVFGIALMITWPKGGVANKPANEEIVSWSKNGQPTTTPTQEQLVILEASATPTTTSLPDIEVKVVEAVSTLVPEAMPARTGKQPVVIVKTAEPAVVKAKPQKTTTKQKATAVVKNYSKRYTEYWIQAGSFKSRASAENQNNLLAEKGFSCQIKTKVIESTTYYRVRIGPYINKDEANKFLTWIKDLPDMAESYISESYVVR